MNSVLRALHFFEENKRVEASKGSFKEAVLRFLNEYHSLRQFVLEMASEQHTNGAYREQGITVALAARSC